MVARLKGNMLDRLVVLIIAWWATCLPTNFKDTLSRFEVRSELGASHLIECLAAIASRRKIQDINSSSITSNLLDTKLVISRLLLSTRLTYI